MTREEMGEALTKVAEYARDVGLYGVMILSPRCAKCGNCHDFVMSAGAVDATDPEGSVKALLLRFADVATDMPPEYIDLPRSRQ